MQLQAGGEVGKAGLELGNLLLLHGEALLLLRQHMQEGAHALADGKRRRCPVVERDPNISRWQVAVHAASMPAIGTPVKWRRSGGPAEAP